MKVEKAEAEINKLTQESLKQVSVRACHFQIKTLGIIHYNHLEKNVYCQEINEIMEQIKNDKLWDALKTDVRDNVNKVARKMLFDIMELSSKNNIEQPDFQLTELLSPCILKHDDVIDDLIVNYEKLYNWAKQV